jgi:NO-binding membrane sensor protein with MHYT domain
MNSTIDGVLAAVSLLFAIAASYAAFEVAAWSTATLGRTRIAMLTGAAAIMGIGIWATHYIGILAFGLRNGDHT